MLPKRTLVVIVIVVVVIIVLVEYFRTTYFVYYFRLEARANKLREEKHKWKCIQFEIVNKMYFVRCTPGQNTPLFPAKPLTTTASHVLIKLSITAKLN